MNITEAKVGAQYTLDHQVYEIVSINDGQIALCSLIHQYRRFLDVATFASMEQRGQLRMHQLAASDLSAAAQLAALRPDQQKLFRYRLAYVEAWQDQMEGRFTKAEAIKLIDRVAKKIGDAQPPSPSTLWNWKDRFLAGNQSPFSLLKQRPAPRRKRLPLTVEDLIRHYIDTVYLTLERPTLRHTHRLLVGHVAAENRERHQYGVAHLLTPSYATFTRRVHSLDGYRVVRERYGLKAAQRATQSSGHLFIDADPYACTLFDSKHMDVMLINQHGDVVGRPILSAHLNPASRELAGWDIAMGAPCAEKMLSATIRAIVRHGKMATVYSDHGKEIFNTWSLDTFGILGISTDYVPVGDPNAKAFIERLFRTVDSGFCHHLPGTTKGSIKDRGDYPSAKRACLSLDNLRSAFADWVEVYHNTWQDELETSPLKKGEALRLDAPPAERFAEEELNQLCLSHWYLSVDRGRVTKAHLIWWGSGLAEVSLKLKAKQKAIVHFNPCDLGTVWVAHPDTPTNWHPAIGTNADYQKGLTLSDHNAVRRSFIIERRKFDHTEACIRLYELNEKIKTFKAQAKKHVKKKPTTYDSTADSLTLSTKLPHPTTDESNFDTYKVPSGGHHEQTK
jgi:hypothetical protein